MPLYEYQCDACDTRFERIQKFSDPPVETCPSCGGAVRKLFSSPAIQFKGSGWYITDYARKGAAGKGTDGKGAGEGQAKTGSDGKAATDSKAASSGTDSGAASSSSSSPKSND